MKNILDYDSYLKEEWERIFKSKNGDISIKKIGDKPILVNDPDDIDDINQVVNRAIRDDIKKFCGGIRSFETKYKDGIIKPLYSTNPKTFSDIISEGEYGYCSIKNDLNIEDTTEVENLFSLKVSKLGNGEVLMPCLFPDVKLGRRMFKGDETDKQTPDCTYSIEGENPDGDIEVRNGNIEVKSCGSEFKYVKDYANSIVDHMLTRCKNGKETVFVFFDNTYVEDSNFRNTNNDPEGFFWIKCGNKTEKDLIADIENNIIVSKKINTRPKQEYFAISYDNKKKKIVIHPRKKSEN